MRTQIVKSHEGFFFPQVEVDGEFKFLVEYGRFKEGKPFYPFSYETYDTPITGYHRTEKDAQDTIDRYLLYKIPTTDWEIVSRKEV